MLHDNTGYKGGKKKVRPKTPRNPTTEHEGRVTQPGVPSGPRNSAGGTKTVVTVKADGSVSATGPEAKAAAAEARRSLVRVRATNAKTKVTKAGVEVNPAKGTPAIDKVPGAVKLVVKALERQDSSSAPVRSAVEDEVKNVVKVAKESVTPGREARGIVKIPTSSETRAAAAIATPVLGDAGAAADVADAGKSAAAKAAEKVSEETARVASKPARTVQAIKDVPTKVKEFPGKVQELPKDVRDALETPDARRAAAKSVGKSAAKHPIKAGVPALAVVPGGTVPGNASDRARALLTGLGHALEHPGDMGEATAKGVLGAFTAPAGVAAAAVQSAKEGNPKALEDQLGMYKDGILEMGQELISGNVKEIEQSFRHKIGYTPFIPAGAIGRAAKDSKWADEVRGKVRGAAEDRRTKKREPLINKEREATEEGAYVSAKNKRKLEKLESIPDSKREGQHYVNRKAGKFIEKQRARHQISRLVNRVKSSGDNAAKAAVDDVIKNFKKSKGVKNTEINFSDGLKVFAELGIPFEEETGKSFIRMLHEGYKKNEHGDVPVAGVVLDRHVVRYILDNPKIFTDEHFKAGVEKFHEKSEPLGTSPRNRHLGQVNQILNPLRKAAGKRPILKPEERVPKATSDLMDTLVKDRDPVKDPWSRDEVLNYAKDLKGSDEPLMKGAGKELEASLVDDEGNPLMRSPEHGGAKGGVTTTRSTAWTPKMLKDFVDEAEAGRKDAGLRRPAAYVNNTMADGFKDADLEKLPNHAAQLPANKIWPSSGHAASSGNALSDFEHTIYKSLEAPHHRAALRKGVDSLATNFVREVNGRKALTDKEFKQALNRHEVPPGTVALRPQVLNILLKGEHTADSKEFREALEGQIEGTQKLSMGEDLNEQLGALKDTPGEKLIPVDGVAINEFLNHMKPITGVGATIAKGTRYASRMILNSPAFALIQPIQEGVPLAAALGRDVLNLPEAIKNVYKAHKLGPDGQAEYKATVGSSAGFFGSPDQAALNAEGYLDPIRMAARPKLWRKAWSLFNGKTLGDFDRNRAGFMREVAADARIQGDFKRATGNTVLQKAFPGFKKYGVSARNLFKDMDKAVADMKGMNADERHAYIAANPELADRLNKAMDGMAGNWNSFTVFEKHVAPLTMFYTFQRYSALFMLYHFPMDHPIVATAMTTLGQVNARELEKLAAVKGGKPGILDYTQPVVKHPANQQQYEALIKEGIAPGKAKFAAETSVSPLGKRAFPGLGTVQQAAITGKPSSLIGAAPPPLAITAEALLGKSSYTGSDIEENGFEFAAKQVANLNPGFRLFMGLTGIEEKSTASKTFHEQDPLSTVRSVVNPFIGQTGPQYAQTKKIEKDFNDKYGAGKLPNSFENKLVEQLLYGGPGGKPQPQLLPKVLEAIHGSEQGGINVKKDESKAAGPEEEFGSVREELLSEIEKAWETGPGSEESSSSSNPFSAALSESKSASAINPFSKALSESSVSSGPNPFSQALAK